MPGMFDDLIPQQQAPQQGGSMFDDLIPQQAQAAGPMSWGQVGSEVDKNLLPSAVQYGKETLEAIMDPIGTAKGLYALGKGGIQHAGTALGLRSGVTPEMEVASQFAQGVAEDYGNTERFKRKLSRDPVGAGMDVLLPVSLLRSPWAISRGERLARKAPQVKELEGQAKKKYDTAKQSGAVFSPQDMQDLTNDIGRMLLHEGADPSGQAVRILEGLRKYRPLNAQYQVRPNPLTSQDVHILRKRLRGLEKSPNAEDRRLAGLMKKKMDAFIGAKIPEFVEGNKLWAKAKERERVEKLIRKGERRGSSVYTQSGPENALRRQFESVAGDEKKLRTYSAPVQQAIEKTSGGTVPSNIARRFGRYAPTSPIQFMAGGGGSAYLGDLLLGMPGIGPAVMGSASLSRAIATKGTRSRAHKAAALAGTGGRTPMDFNAESNARIAAVLHEIEESRDRRNRGQY